jgi:ABC-type transporter Mla MlaB component
VEIDMADVDEVDPVGLATTVTLIRRHLDEGAAVVLCAPPQMIAHTLYKAALLESDQLRIEAARAEEPYAG